jgi:hypothetical protein
MNHYPRIKGYQDVPANRPQKESERASISAQVEEYLRSGGVISSVEHGATGDGFKAKRLRSEVDDATKKIVFNNGERNADLTTKNPRTKMTGHKTFYRE